MHNRIYQIEQNPISEEDYISENDFIGHWFIGSIADYVDDDVNRREEIEYLLSSLETHKVARVDRGNDSFVIFPDGKKVYFSTDYAKFKEARDKTMELGLKDFSEGGAFSKLVHTMQDAFCEEFGSYVSSDDNEIVTLDEFVRSASIDQPYYIGGVLNYHW